MLWKPFLLALIPAAITSWLPRRWLLLWLPLFWGGLAWLWSSLDFTDDPAFIEAAMAFVPLWLINVIVTLARVAVVLSDLHREAGRGYSDAE
jgi:hypothetical protein